MLYPFELKLGKKAALPDARTLKLENYLAPSLPSPPNQIDWTRGVKVWPFLLNDNLGDCTIAAALHAVQIWMLPGKTPYHPADSVALNYYEKWDGYVNGDPNTDNGGYELTVLNSWRQQKLDSHVLWGYADPQPQNVLHVKQSVAFFGGVYIGLQLPVSAQAQVGTIWDVVPNSGGIWGGHAVYCAAYNSTGPICITWNQIQPMTWAFWNKYCDESHTLLGNAWEPPIGQVPILKDKFHADLKLVTG